MESGSPFKNTRSAISYREEKGRFLFLTTISLWNSCSQKVGEVESLNIFKPEVDRFSIRKKVKGVNTQLKMHSDLHHLLNGTAGSKGRVAYSGS